MSRPIDEKIVRMTLDNANFKRDVQATLRSFEDINRATRDAGSLDLSNMAKGISNIERRFSGAGVVVASVLNSLTTSALKMGKGVYHAMVDPIVEGGKTRALNIEQAKFQFEGLGMDVDKTMASALEAVKGTAYGLDEAAIVAGQFGASGMKAGSEMTESLRGIAGVAAMTGSSYSDVGNIFTKVAGNGRLMGDDLLRLGARGVNAAAVLAKEFDMTEEAVRELVTAGGVSFDMFSQAMSNAFGEHATRANETFTGSLANMKAALGRIGAEFQANKFEQYRRVINAVTPAIDDMGAAILPVTQAVNELATQIADWLIVAINKISFDKFIKLGGIGNIVQGFWNIVSAGKRILSSITEAFMRMFPPVTIEGLVKLTEGFKNLTSNMTMGTKTYEKVTTIFEGIFSIFSTVWEIALVLGEALFGIIPDGFAGGLLDVAESAAEMAIAFNESVKEGNWLTDSVQWIGEKLRWLVDGLVDVTAWVINFAKSLKDNLGKAIGWLKEKLAPLGQWIKEAFGDIGGEEILSGGFIVAVGLLAFKLGGFLDKVVNAVDKFSGRVTSVFTELGNAIRTFQKNVKYKSLLLIAASVLALAIALKIMEGIDAIDIAKGLAALGTALGGMVGAMAILDKFDITMPLRTAIGLLALSVAVGIMAIALKKISDLNPNEMITGLAGIMGIVAVLSIGVIAISKLGDKIAASSLGLIALATSVVILSIAVKKMSDIDAGDLAKSVTALGVIFLELAIFLRIVKNSGIGVGTGVGMMGVAAAIHIIIGAIKKIADMDVPMLTKGLVTIALILAAVAGFSYISGGPVLMAAGAGLVLVAAGLTLMMVPLRTMAGMSWPDLIKGLVGMALGLAAVAVAAVAASAGAMGAVAITLMAAAMTLLIVPIKMFAGMTWGEIAKGIGTMAIALTVLGLAGYALTPAIPGMLGTAGAVLALGAAVLLAGAGIAAFGWGLTLLATMTATSIAAIISSLGLLIKGLGSLITGVVQFLVDLGSALIGGLMRLVPELIEAIHTIALAMLEGWRTNIDSYIEIGAEILIKVMEGLGTYAPILLETAQQMMIDLMNGMSDALEQNGDAIIQAMSRLMGEMLIIMVKGFAAVITGIFGQIPGVSEAMDSLVAKAEGTIRENFNPDGEFTTKIEGAASSMSSNTSISAAATTVGTSGMTALERLNYYSAGGMMGSNTGRGLSDSQGKVSSAATVMGTAGMSAAEKLDFYRSGGFVGGKFATGISSTSGQSSTSGTKISTTANTSAGALNFAPTGTSKGTQFATGVSGTSGAAGSAGTAITSMADRMAMAKNFSPTGTSKGSEFATGISGTSGQSGASGTLISSTADRMAASIGFSPTGTAKGSEFATGISGTSGQSSGAGSTIAGSAKTGASSISLYESGSNMGSGFVKGIGAWAGKAATAAAGLASRAMEAIKKKSKSKSPSKETTWMGEDFGEGFEIGIDSWGKKVALAAGGIAQQAMDAIDGSIGLFPEEENELRFKVIIDDSNVDWGMFDPRELAVRPNSSYTNSLATSASSHIRQNEDNLIREMLSKIENSKYDDYELLSATLDQNEMLRDIVESNRGIEEKPVLSENDIKRTYDKKDSTEASKNGIFTGKPGR